MQFTYDQLAELWGPDHNPELIEHYRPSLEYILEIQEQVKADLPGVSLDDPEAIALRKHYVRHGLPYEQGKE